MKRLSIGRYGTLLVFFALLSACSNAPSNVERREMFSMEIGRMEDQLDLVQHAGTPFSNNIGIELRAGLFYVSDSKSRKIMQFNSYGDLLLLLYNAHENPAPVLVSGGKADGTVANRRAVVFPFLHVGRFAVSESGNIYVEDYVEESLRAFDSDSGSQLKAVVLKFHPDGTFDRAIGQEGAGGTPFPFISNIYATTSGGVVVVCRTARDWRIFGYSAEAVLQYHVRIDSEGVPLPEGVRIASITNVKPGVAGDPLIFKVNFLGGDEDNLDYAGSRLLFYDPYLGDYTQTVDLPPVLLPDSVPGTRRAGSEGREALYELAGVAIGGYSFCIAPLGGGTYRMLIISQTGETIYLGSIKLDDEDTLIRSVRVTPEGIMTALVAGSLDAKVFVWRFDGVISEVYDETR